MPSLLVNYRTMGAYIEDFLREKHRCSKFTQKNYRTVLLEYSKYTKDFTQLESLESYLLIKHQQGCKASAVNSYLRTISSFYTFCNIHYNIKNIALLCQRLPQLPCRQRILSDSEYAIINEKITDSRRTIIVFLCHTGLRAREFLSLRPENIYDDFIHIVGKGRNGGKSRDIPINNTIRDIIAKDPNLTFIKPRGYNWLMDMCHFVAQEVGIPKFAPHSCRHRFANVLHQKKVPIDIIARLMGHASSAVTEKIYLHWRQDELKNALDCLDS